VIAAAWLGGGTARESRQRDRAEAPASNSNKKKNGNQANNATGDAENASSNPGNEGNPVEGATDWFTKTAYALAKGA
jgi:hypothetical protein